MTALLQDIRADAGSASAFLGIAASARGFRWVERLGPSQLPIAQALAQAHGLPELLGRVLAARGAEQETLSHYLDPSIKALLPDPSRLRDMDKAAERFARAIVQRERIAVFGDYDVDGGASVALVRRFLRSHGHDARPYIPDRLTEGYGPSPDAMRMLAADGATLILTVDCGTAATAAIEAANKAAADVIVVDHHQADEVLPPAFAVLNPNRQDDLSGQGHLAAAGVVFLFLVATTRRLRGQGAYRETPEPELLRLLDLVALATVCDVVPLKGVNRALVAKGLRVLRQRQNGGLRALADAARLDAAPSCYTLGFILGPRINAGGRIGDSGLGARLLATDDDMEARAIAARLEELNAERRTIEDRMQEEAFSLAEASLEAAPELPLVFVGAEGWHRGLLGLLAGRMAERFHRPALAVAWDSDGTGTGSARSIASVDLGETVRRAVRMGLLEKGGGHAMAAGFKLRREMQAGLLRFFAERLSTSVATARGTRTLAIDGALSAGAATLDLLALLDRAGPYGAGHPEPRFAFPAHRITRLRPINGAHLRCTLQAQDGARLEACAFRVADAPLGKLLMRSEGASLHVSGHLRRNVYEGRESVELAIDDAADLAG